jgi:hypothetical protein
MPSDTIFLLTRTVSCPNWSCTCFIQYKILVQYEVDRFQFTHTTYCKRCCTQYFEFLSYEIAEALLNGDQLSLHC